MARGDATKNMQKYEKMLQKSIKMFGKSKKMFVCFWEAYRL